MGHATPYDRVRLPIPVLKAPELLDPYPASSQPVDPVPPEVLERLRKDPWALNTVDPALRERIEVLRATIESGHPQAMEVISVYVPPEVLRRPEIYEYLKDYRRDIVPKRIFFFQGSLGLGLGGEGLGLGLGGEVGLGGPRYAGKLFYDRLGTGPGEAEQRLGLEPLVLLYPAKRISMRERQSIVTLGLPLVANYQAAGRERELGLSLAYYLAKGEVLASPLFGLEARFLVAPLDPQGSPTTTLELKVPVWSTLEGIERLGQRVSHR